MRNNITLIGMPGVGKSTYGVVLAKNLGMNFIDSDLLIQAKHKATLSEIIQRVGTERFLEIEGEVNSEILVENSVIATGGSAVYHDGAMRHLKDLGVVLYLKIKYENLDERLGDLDARGVAHEPNQTLLDIYQERCALYEKYADITVDTDEKSIGELLDDVKSKLREFRS